MERTTTGLIGLCIMRTATTFSWFFPTLCFWDQDHHQSSRVEPSRKTTFQLSLLSVVSDSGKLRLVCRKELSDYYLIGRPSTLFRRIVLTRVDYVQPIYKKKPALSTRI